jgi:hypothetical protein
MRTLLMIVGFWGLLLTPMPEVAYGGPAKTAQVKATQVGLASWYGKPHQGRKRASRERFLRNQLTAAHRSLPLGTKVKVTNLRTKQPVVVRINDRGPYVGALRGSPRCLKRARSREEPIASKKSLSSSWVR